MARIEAQGRAASGQAASSMAEVMGAIVRERGVAGLFAGLVPRACLSVYQTLFMVTAAKVAKEWLAGDK